MNAIRSTLIAAFALAATAIPSVSSAMCAAGFSGCADVIHTTPIPFGDIKPSQVTYMPNGTDLIMPPRSAGTDQGRGLDKLNQLSSNQAVVNVPNSGDVMLYRAPAISQLSPAAGGTAKVAANDLVQLRNDDPSPVLINIPEQQ